jgi:hypothetical protein
MGELRALWRLTVFSVSCPIFTAHAIQCLFGSQNDSDVPCCVYFLDPFMGWMYCSTLSLNSLLLNTTDLAPDVPSGTNAWMHLVASRLLFVEPSI